MVTNGPPWTLLGAVVAAPSVLYSWWSRTVHKDDDARQSREQLEHSKEQLKLEQLQARDSLAAQQFNAGVELLYSDAPPKRSAGIYSLQRVARYSEHEADAVSEVLAAFVRLQAAACDPVGYEEPEPIDEFVQSALLVLGSLSKGPRPINLRRIDLSYARIEGDFSGADFSQSIFYRAHLRGTFDGATFRGARFVESTIAGSFRNAIFEDMWDQGCTVEPSCDFTGVKGARSVDVLATVLKSP